jgi:hypothetical protein
MVGLEREWKAAAIYEFETAIQRFSGRTGVKERNFQARKFYIFRTVYLCIILVGNKLDAHFLLWYVWVLYIFRATMSSSSGGQLYEYNFWYNHSVLVTIRYAGQGGTAFLTCIRLKCIPEHFVLKHPHPLEMCHPRCVYTYIKYGLFISHNITSLVSVIYSSWQHVST